MWHVVRAAVGFVVLALLALNAVPTVVLIALALKGRERPYEVLDGQTAEHVPQSS